MSTVSGVIKKVYCNPQGFYSLIVDDVFHGTGSKDAPNVSAGQAVSFETYLKNGKYSTIKGPITQLVTQPAQTRPTQAAVAGSGTAFQSRDTYWKDKETYDREIKEPRIAYFAAIERAIHFTDVVLREKALPGIEKAKPNERHDIIKTYVLELADELVKFASGEKPQARQEDAGSSAAEDKWAE